MLVNRRVASILCRKDHPFFASASKRNFVAMNFLDITPPAQQSSAEKNKKYLSLDYCFAAAIMVAAMCIDEEPRHGAFTVVAVHFRVAGLKIPLL